jgi:outer membrane protein assembly factor BamB
VTTSPSLDEAGDVYVAAGSGSSAAVLFALHGATGTLKWKYSDGGNASVCRQHTPLYVNGVVYWSCAQLSALRSADGSVVFSIPAVASPLSYRALAWNGNLLSIDTTVGGGASLTAVNASTGAVAWSTALPEGQNPQGVMVMDFVAHVVGDAVTALDSHVGDLQWALWNWKATGSQGRGCGVGCGVSRACAVVPTLPRIDLPIAEVVIQEWCVARAQERCWPTASVRRAVL